MSQDTVTLTLERTQEAIASHLEDLLLRTQKGYRARTLDRDAARRAARRILDHPWGSYREHGGEVGLSHRYRAETSLLEVSWIWAQGGRVRLRARSTRVGALRPPEEGFFLNTLLSLAAEETENPEAIARVHRLAEELGALPPPRLHHPVLQRIEPEGGEPFYLIMDPMHGEWALLPGSRPIFITEQTMLGHQSSIYYPLDGAYREGFFHVVRLINYISALVLVPSSRFPLAFHIPNTQNPRPDTLLQHLRRVLAFPPSSLLRAFVRGDLEAKEKVEKQAAFFHAVYQALQDPSTSLSVDHEPNTGEERFLLQVIHDPSLREPLAKLVRREVLESWNRTWGEKVAALLDFLKQRPDILANPTPEYLERCLLAQEILKL